MGFDGCAHGLNLTSVANGFPHVKYFGGKFRYIVLTKERNSLETKIDKEELLFVRTLRLKS